MSMSLLSRERIPERTAPADANPVADAMTHAMLRGIGIVMLLGMAVIHVVQLVPTFQQLPVLGIAYLILIVGAVVVVAHLVKGAASSVYQWLPVAGLGMAVIGGYVFTRLFSTPLDDQDVGNWSCTLGMAALFVEGSLVAMAAYAISHGRRLVRVPESAGNDLSHDAAREDITARRTFAAWN